MDLSVIHNIGYFVEYAHEDIVPGQIADDAEYVSARMGRATEAILTYAIGIREYKSIELNERCILTRCRLLFLLLLPLSAVIGKCELLDIRDELGQFGIVLEVIDIAMFRIGQVTLYLLRLFAQFKLD